jgi:hypothetical protein
MNRSAPILLAAAMAAAPGTPRAQGVAAQQRRLMEIHALLLDLPPVQPPAALPAGAIQPSLEAVTIPPIDGTVGDKRELTAADHTRLFPRPRLALGLPAPPGLRAFAGLSYIPPVRIRRVSVDDLAAEAGLGAAPGRLLLGVRVYALYASATAPVTVPTTRDELQAWEWGADVSAGLHLGGATLAVDPYLGAGLVLLRARFHVAVDGSVLRSERAIAALHAGVRLALGRRWEVVAESDTYPGRLTHASLRLGYRFGGSPP